MQMGSGNIRQMSYAGEGNYEGRTRNPICHVPNIGKIEIVNHLCAHFVSPFECIT